MASTGADQIRHAKPLGDLFSQPRGLTFLFATEMWERFSYYGMRAVLVLYMTKYLLGPGRAEGVIGLDGLRALLESMSGPLGVQPFSSLIYGNYTAFVYLTPFFGGIIADRWIGQRFSVIIGGVTMAIAEFTLMEPRLFFIGLLLLIVGNGFFKPNISTQVGNLYKAGDSRIDRAYSIFYVGINIGAFLAPPLRARKQWAGTTLRRASGDGRACGLLPPAGAQTAGCRARAEPLDRSQWRP